jgi:phosphopantothenoylcysteine decarboxylase / phosphopantothenate---cysteine ligase
MLQNRNILLGISGSIAAYKSASLTRLLVKAGAQVKVIMTESAKDFITPLTLATLSKNKVNTQFADAEGTWHNHVELGLWADVMLIAPASANTIAKMANGLCDNLLLATYLSARCKVYFAPAMDLDMLQHPATQENITRLTAFGNQLIKPNTGELASGLYGTGRMAEPEEIVALLEHYFGADLPLTGKKALVTAGPTYEAIDPVRFIGNHSSGKMGFALAEQLAAKGAEVTLVCGPNALAVASPAIKRIDVTSAEEMYKVSSEVFKDTHIAVLAAAVADYKPAHPATEKIKKAGNEKILELIKTVDIAATLGAIKRQDQFLVGFALETTNEEANAIEKLRAKNFDCIVLNSLRNAGAGFKYDTNQVKIIDKENNSVNFELKSKQEVAVDIVNHIIKKYTDETHF